MEYVGLAQSVRAVHPKKKPLDRQDLDRTTKVSTDRVIVENFFGRVCLVWKISYGTYVCDSKFYDEIHRLTFALTNFPFAHHYRSILARYARMAEEKKS
ncbi:hypothetical protein DYB34_005907 [Aphanomyces astaci]|uniref:DDE Tnp4 domain-containing protein n=1 Tax=Aphanomyces astaci TaxID=112090 RepID=A0A397EXI6_APHAT|nr:hypothetical protein DYB34_005907 [Aphanomyces astaci]RHZ02529.1 hypothetical protein DYB31_015288 [Aphanomyces astaci]